MAKIKGISLNLNKTGEVSVTEGYEVKPSPFDELQELVEQFEADGSGQEDIEELLHILPTPDQPETHIGVIELELLNRYWRIAYGEQGTGKDSSRSD